MTIIEFHENMHRIYEITVLHFYSAFGGLSGAVPCSAYCICCSSCLSLDVRAHGGTASALADAHVLFIHAGCFLAFHPIYSPSMSAPSGRASPDFGADEHLAEHGRLV